MAQVPVKFYRQAIIYKNISQKIILVCSSWLIKYKKSCLKTAIVMVFLNVRYSEIYKK